MKFLGVLLASMTLNVISRLILSLVTGWALMLAVGVAHHEWLHGRNGTIEVPTIGYWWAVLLAFLLGFALAPASDTSDS